MITFLTYEKKKSLLSYPFYGAYMKGDLDKKTCAENLEQFRPDLINDGILDVEVTKLIELVLGEYYREDSNKVVVKLSKIETERIKRKILSTKDLPKFSEIENLYNYLCEKDEFGWSNFCTEDKKNIIYSPENVEFISELAHEIKRLHIPSKRGNIVEVCAGLGKLSYHLRKNDIDIIPTDPQILLPLAYDEKLAEKRTHLEILEKYNPILVISKWPPQSSYLGEEILNHPSVSYYIEISEGPAVRGGGLSGSAASLYPTKGWKLKFLLNVERYNIFIEDHGLRHRDHKTVVSLFKRK